VAEYAYHIEVVNSSGVWVSTNAIHKPTQISEQGARGVLHECRMGNPRRVYRLVKLHKEILDG
jgi:hypothetical protein